MVCYWKNILQLIAKTVFLLFKIEVYAGRLTGKEVSYKILHIIFDKRKNNEIANQETSKGVRNWASNEVIFNFKKGDRRMEEAKKEEDLNEKKEKKNKCSWKDETKWPPMIRFVMSGGRFM